MEEKIHDFVLCIEILKDHVYHPHVKAMEFAV
jgi:hypothetical protein